MRRTFQDESPDEQGDVICPCCRAAFPTFGIVELTPEEATALGVSWACGHCLNALTPAPTIVAVSDPTDPWGDNEVANGVRASRAQRLAACDWTQVTDSPLSVEAKAAWAVYRQALRDITTSATDPESISWPNPPE